MAESLGFEYDVMKHYLNKGMWARAGLIDILIKNLREHAKRERISQELGLDEKEVTAALQIAVISHIMMWMEDLAVFCEAIGEGKIDYYEYLDRSGDQDLGKVVGEFYSEVTSLSDDKLAKILSYAEASSWEYILDSEREIVSRIQSQIIEKTRLFFDKLAMFKDNHHGIFRRYKHAGFPILLAQPIPADIYDHNKFEFATLGLISKKVVGAEVLPIPFSLKAVDSYENLKKDMFSFLGNVISFKFICLERGVKGLVPHRDNVFGIKLTSDEETILDNVWRRFEAEYPTPKGRTNEGFDSMIKILRWYEDIDNTSVRVLF